MKRSKKKTNDEKQIAELVRSMRICSQCSTCADCMFRPMRIEYEKEFGAPEFTCRSALLDVASGLICDLTNGG